MKDRGIFFDLYGTLFIFGDMKAAWNDWSDAYYNCVIEFGYSIDEKKIKSSLNGFFAKPRPVNLNTGLTIYEHRIKEQCESIGLSCDTSQLQIIAATTITAWQKHIRLDNDAIPLLNKLKNNFILALVSNFDHPPHIYSLFSDLGLTPFFNQIIISGEVGVDKPDPKIFKAALNKTNLLPGNVWFVGDSVEDMEGSKASGLKPVYIKREREENDHVFVDFHSDHNHPDRIQKQPDKDGIIEIAYLTDLTTIIDMEQK